MQHVQISTSFPGTVLSSSKALEKFMLSGGELWTTDSDSPYIYAASLSKAVCQHKRFLKSLYLDIRVMVYDSCFCAEDHIADTHDIWDQHLRGKQRCGEEHLRVDNEISLVSSMTHEEDTRTKNSGFGSFPDYPALPHITFRIRNLLGYPGEKFDPASPTGGYVAG